MADLSITAVKTISKPKPVALLAGETVNLFDIIYLDGTTQSVFQCLATNSAKLAAKYIVTGAALVGEYATGVELTQGLVLELTGPTIAVSSRYVLSANAAGKIAPLVDLASTNYLVELLIGKTAAQAVVSITNTGIQVP